MSVLSDRWIKKMALEKDMIKITADTDILPTKDYNLSTKTWHIYRSFLIYSFFGQYLKKCN